MPAERAHELHSVNLSDLLDDVDEDDEDDEDEDEAQEEAAEAAALPDGAAQFVRALATHLGGQFEQLAAQAGLGPKERQMVAAALGQGGA